MERLHKQEYEKVAMDVIINVGEKFGAGNGSINAGENTLADAEALGQTVKEHLVPVDGNAPSCCIDGRGCNECLDGSPTEPRPSVAGGAGTTTYAAAELVGWFAEDMTGANSNKRFETVLDTLKASGVTPGNHCDRGSVDADYTDALTNAPKTGCGANDKLPVILQTLYDEYATVDSFVTTLQSVKSDSLDQLQIDPAERVIEQVKDWNPVEAMIATTAGSNGHNIEVLEATHGEVLVVFNYVEDHTIDRDAELAATGTQVFIVDMWYVDKLAAALSAGRENENDWFAKLRSAMTAYQVATYLTLCDGSQRPAFVTAA